MFAITDRRGRRVLILTGGMIALSAVELLSVLAMVVAVAVSAPAADLWPTPLILALAVLAMSMPDSAAGLLTLLAYGGWWFAACRSASWLEVLAVAMAAVTFHLSLAHGAAAPPGAVTRLPVIRAQLVDVIPVGVLTGAVALVAAALQGFGLHAPAFVIGAALLLIGLLPWIAGVGRSPR